MIYNTIVVITHQYDIINTKLIFDYLSQCIIFLQTKFSMVVKIDWFNKIVFCENLFLYQQQTQQMRCQLIYVFQFLCDFLKNGLIVRRNIAICDSNLLKISSKEISKEIRALKQYSAVYFLGEILFQKSQLPKTFQKQFSGQYVFARLQLLIIFILKTSNRFQNKQYVEKTLSTLQTQVIISFLL
eukprot:TRINITY_DN292_c1_g1_i1.p1 TRINITY_DN292_c1_g1~~TRINITY_DN292_c1_g1_i1.p1  ORF type:complete len:185 (+),score=-18.69 TRINITY_DN292_c1_g1_i1:264-818(+)